MCNNHNQHPNQSPDNDSTIDQQQGQTTDVNALQKELQECLLSQQEWKERFLRTNADFENFKRRSTRDQITWMETSQQKLLVELLPIVDDFDRAFQQISTNVDQKAVAKDLEGFSFIRAALQKYLQQFGVEPMKEYTVFDPSLHEAIGQVSDSTKSSGAIAQVLQQGYMWKGKVLRPARVMVVE